MPNRGINVKASRIITITMFATMMISSVSMHAKDLGKHGATYPIVERDLTEELKERAAKVDLSKQFDMKKMKKKVTEFRPENMKSVPTANKDRTFQVDMTYTLDHDIQDGKGGIIYPRGYTFNPLDYMQVRDIIIIINGEDKRQLDWYRKSPYRVDIRSRVLITDGLAYHVSRELKQHVFYANKIILDRFNIQAVPSIVYRNGNVMEVREVEIAKTKRKKIATN
ncbi:MAG: hypothetical protein CSYNP_04001 [Syntrophus sp. SKADARSKE-3]|nr:hypothetical protein [Syntrophus sp. SKADARSKE-3]